MSERKLTVGVIFGSRSVEHDVSVVTATQVMKALNPAKYQVIPIYITRDGTWYTGTNLNQLRNFNLDDISQLAGTQATLLSPNTAHQGIITPPIAGRLSKNTLQKLDVVFPVIHGSHGEDGTLQGLLELADLPYVGTGVLASALANDKGKGKIFLKAQGIPVVEPYLQFSRQQWFTQRERILEQIAQEVGYPAFVKPVTLGSSIGIAHIATPSEAALHLDIAANLDRQLLVERAVEGEHIAEINCAVLGNESVRASTLEQPISYKTFLDFEEKYTRKGGMGMKGQERLIPAPLNDDLTAKIQQTACDTFQAIGGRGTARIDFLVNQATGDYWVNEINTMPGSLAFYLWEDMGLSATAICDELIQLALAEHAEKRQTTYNYKSGLIQLAASRTGVKGSKI